MKLLFEGISSSIILCSLVVIAHVVWRLWHRQQLIPWSPRQPVPWNSADLGVCVLIWFIAQITGGAALAELGYAVKSETLIDVEVACAFNFANIAASIVTVMLWLLWLQLRAGANPADLGTDTSELPKYLGYGLAGYLFAVVPVIVIQLSISRLDKTEHPIVQMLRNDPPFNLAALTFLSVVVAAPLAEELLFRVIFQGWLEKLETFVMAQRHGAEAQGVVDDDLVDQAIVEALSDPQQANEADDNRVSPSAGNRSTPAPARSWLGLPQGWWPILISSTLFASMHWGSWPDPVPLVFFAAMLGYLYQRTHRLWPSLVAHMLLNFVTWLTLVAGVAD